MISEDKFPQDEALIGGRVHLRNGVWWSRVAPFYHKPLHEFRGFAPLTASPHPLKGILGYSHQVQDPIHANRWVRWTLLQGEDLERFSLERLPKKRRAIRAGLRNCRVEAIKPSDLLTEQMRIINISQAERFDGVREPGTFLPADHYEQQADQWKAKTLELFAHRGHCFFGAFLGGTLVAYVDLVTIEDTWAIGAVKSHTEHLRNRPVDALYFTLLEMASHDEKCARVVNGGPDGAPHGLVAFKEKYLFKSISVPYFTRSLLPLDRLRQLTLARAFRGRGRP